MVAVYLADHQIPVRTASNAFEALDAVRSSPPVLILLDLMMPQLSGESFRRFLSADPRLAGIPAQRIINWRPAADILRWARTFPRRATSNVRHDNPRTPSA
jgi:CheY-like chemotaxis protein